MNEKEQVIVSLAETYSDPDKFISASNNFFKPELHKKGNLFLEIGAILWNYSYDVMAFNSWNYALKYFIKTDDKKGEVICYTNLGLSYDSLGDFRKAIEFHEKSLKIAKEIEDIASEAKCYTSLGISYYNLGDFRKAIGFHEKSLKIAKEIEDRSLEVKCYTNLGVVYDSLGDFRKAIEFHEKSLKIAKEIEDTASEAKCYTNLGVVYDSLGDFRKAIKFHVKSLKIAKEIEDTVSEAACYANLGVIYYGLEYFRKAVKFHEKSLKIAKEIEDRSLEIKCYTNLGLTYDSLGDFRKAIEFHEKSLRIAKEIGDRAGEATCYINLGGALENLGRFRRAIKSHEMSLKIAKEIEDIDTERIANLSIGLIYLESKPELAYSYCKRSIELSEVISGRLVEEEHKIGYYSEISDAYQKMVPLCLKLKKDNEAFEYAEKSKSRAFLELLATTEIRPTVELTSELASLLADEETFLAQLREIQTRYLRQTNTLTEPGEVERIFENLNLIYDKIEKFDPEYVFARRGRPLSLNKILDIFSSQKRNVILVEYFTTENETFIFVVSSKEKKLHVKTVPLSAKKLNRYLNNYWREVANHLDFPNIGDTWFSLGDDLIKPISEILAEGDLIYFVPHGMLHSFPLHALKLDGEPLIKKHPVAYAPSASLIKFCRNKGSIKLETCASFGVAFEEEAEEVAKIFNTEAYTRDLVTKNTVFEKCQDKDVIHFSCHGYFDYLDPLSSGILLHDGEVLTAREIFDMRLNTELVFLSACQTGLNERSSGDELIGLARAILYAGAPSVIASLWSVDARSTQKLMVEFYNQLKDGLDIATALQEAQKKMMEKEEYSHPYYWAPFVLVGDWE